MWPPTPIPGRCARWTVTAAFQRIHRRYRRSSSSSPGNSGSFSGDVVRSGDLRHVQLQLVRGLQKAEHDLAATTVALRLHELLEGLLPLGGLIGIAVEGFLRVRILIVDSHRRPFVVWQIMPGNRYRSAAGFVSPAQRTICQPSEFGRNRTHLVD